MAEGRFSCSMLDCIRSTEDAARNIVSHRKDNTRQLMELLSQREKPISSIVFVGSGTSSTSAITAKAFVEKASGLRTSVIFPNDFLYNTYVYVEGGLYVFTSQTGTSKVALECMRFIAEKGYDYLVISESKETPMAKEARCFLTMDCGIEEYPMRTVGYSATVMTDMILGLEIGLYYHHLSNKEYDHYIEEISAIASRQPIVVEKTLKWLETSKRRFLRSDLIVFTGCDALYGVALEGAMKVWETLQTASVGYELEEGIHGPNYGYNHRHLVVVLNHGGRENEKAQALARYMKDIFKNGLLIGKNPIDSDDLELDLPDEDTSCIDLATVVQIIAYVTARDQGRDLYKHHDNSLMDSYFKTHQ